MNRVPHDCPVCHGKMTITRLSCPSCGTRVSGAFEGCRFCSLSPEETMFLLAFIRNRGSIKDVERELGVSYPTVRAALDGLIASLGLAGDEGRGDAGQGGAPDDAPGGTSDVRSDGAGNGEQNESRDVSGTEGAQRQTRTPDKAKARRDILNLLAQHRITADEAASELKKL